MKTRIILTIVASMLVTGSFSQKSTIELIFTAIDSAAYVQLDSIKVMNRTQGGDTVLYYPDTVLVLDFLPSGIHNSEIEDQGFEVFQNYPNPVTDQTTVCLYVPEKDRVILVVSDMLGRKILKTERMLEEGTHSFRFTPGKGNLFFFTAQWRGHSSSIKILCTGAYTTGTISLEYTGSEPSPQHLKAMAAIQEFSFSPGDELLYIGYADTLQSGMPDSPEQSQTYTFQFATNIPCPGTPTVTYEGQVYHTVQICSQCWLKENLNVGTMIPGTQNMMDNSITEKYCYNNLETACNEWGGLYQWSEMMQYSNIQGIQGICPPGWHIPTDEEWKVVEGVIDSQYGIGDTEWDWWDMRGSDVGHRIKSQIGWGSGMNGSDSHGFSLLPGGFRYFNDGNFYHAGAHANLWTSSERTGEYKWFRFIIGYIIENYRNSTPMENGFSVRCIQN